MIAAGEFTQKMWENTEDTYQCIINSEFITGLASGNLSEESFKHYLSQDIIYIQNDAITLGELSKRATNANEKDFFLKMSKDCIEIENILHGEFLGYFNAEKAKEQSPAFLEYSDFLLNQVNNAPYPVAVAALLPCFWVYGKVGLHILDTQSPNNKYQKFIDTYSGDEYNDYTREFIGIAERHGKNADSLLRKEMINAFKIGSHHEFSVFEEAALKARNN